MQAIMTSFLVLAAAVGAMPAKAIVARMDPINQLGRSGRTANDDGPHPSWHTHDAETLRPNEVWTRGDEPDDISTLHSSWIRRDEFVQSGQSSWTRRSDDGTTEGPKGTGRRRRRRRREANHATAANSPHGSWSRDDIAAAAVNLPKGEWKRGDEPTDGNTPKETWKRSDRTTGADLPHGTWKRGSVVADVNLPKGNWKRGEQSTGEDGPHGTWKRGDVASGVGGPRGGWKRDEGAA